MSNLEEKKPTALEVFAAAVKSGELTANAHGTIKCKGFKVECDIYPDVQINGDNGLVKGTIRMSGSHSSIAEILGSGSHPLYGEFHDISKMKHTYAEYSEDIDNTMYVTGNGKEFEFHKVYLKRKGSLDDFFVFIAQMTKGDIKELTEVFNGVPKLPHTAT
jgi:hypothetical protein